jgi:hypothetical protein
MMTEITPPEPKQKGKYNLYDTPDGGIHIAYTIEGSEEIMHIALPGKIIKMAAALDSGKMSPLAALNGLRGMISG